MVTTSSSGWANPWAEGATDVPAGVVLNVCLVMTNSLPVYMTHLELADGEFSVVFSQNGSPVAYSRSRISDEVLFLDVADSCLYAAVELGNTTGITVRSDTSVRVNPSNILVTEPVVKDKNTITVRQDGIVETARLSTDYSLQIDPRLSARYFEDTKVVKISLNEEAHRGVLDAFVSVEPPTDRIITVNHVRPDADGIVNINIRTTAGDLTMTTSENIPILTISSDIAPCDSSDVIDKYISPSVVRNFAYMPLDEAYEFDDASKAYRRNTIDLLSKYNKLDERYDVVTESQHV